MPPEGFLATQQAFTAWLRHPDTATPPADVPAGRLQVYRELLFNNVSGFVEATFPVARALLPETLWSRLCTSFFADHGCHSPIFSDISLHFREYVDSLDWPELHAFPWLRELLHLEWMELAADTAEVDNPAAQGLPLRHDLPDDETPLRLAVPVWPLAYHWPVATWTTDTDPSPLEPAVSAALYWRDAADDTRLLPVEPLTAWLIEQLQAAPAAVATLAERLCAATPGLDDATARQACRRLLTGLGEAGLAWLA